MKTAEAIEKPARYTDENMAQIAEIKDFLQKQEKIQDKNERVSQGAIARKARISGESLSRILNLNYPSSPTTQLKAVIDAIKNDNAGEHDLTRTRKTSVYKLAFAVCKNARTQRNFGIVSGYVGLGKTHALKDYQAQNKNTILIEIDPTFTQKGLVSEIEKQVFGAASKGSIHQRMVEIVKKLKNTDTLLVIDEAETLTENPLHLIRRIRDKANIGVVLAGTEVLTGKILPDQGVFDQIRSRVGFWPQTMRALDYDDVLALTEAYLGEAVPEDTQKVIFNLCKGSARMLSENLIPQIVKFRPQFISQGETEITPKMVKKVARQTLQVIATD